MDILQEMKRLNLPEGEYVVVGSAVMAVRGIREAHDIDLVVTEKLYNKLKSSGWKERFWKTKRPKELSKDCFDVGTTWSVEGYEPDPAQLIKEAEIINDVAFAKIEQVIAWKKACARPKDLKDIKLIKNYLLKSSFSDDDQKSI